MTAADFIHIVDKRGLVRMVIAGEGNYYDVEQRIVVLTPAIYNGSDRISIAVAAHEYGHAFSIHSFCLSWITKWGYAIHPFIAEVIANMIAFVLLCRYTGIKSAWHGWVYLITHSLVYLSTKKQRGNKNR